MNALRRLGTPAQRIVIDPIACDGFGYCAELLPGLITLDEWGYPIIESSLVPARLLALARLAVKECPRRAIGLATCEQPSDGYSGQQQP